MNQNKTTPNVKWSYMIPIIGIVIAQRDPHAQMTEQQQWWLLTYHTICGLLSGVIVGLIFRAL